MAETEHKGENYTEPAHDKINKMTCADAQADLGLRWAHRSFYWFCHEAVQTLEFGLNKN